MATGPDTTPQAGAGGAGGNSDGSYAIMQFLEGMQQKQESNFQTLRTDATNLTDRVTNTCGGVSPVYHGRSRFSVQDHCRRSQGADR